MEINIKNARNIRGLRMAHSNEKSQRFERIIATGGFPKTWKLGVFSTVSQGGKA
jgi:hypothetical protein